MMDEQEPETDRPMNVLEAMKEDYDDLYGHKY
jgi:hypothetical protein